MNPRGVLSPTHLAGGRTQPDYATSPCPCRWLPGGRRGIRTPGSLSATVVFKTTALVHSAILPGRRRGAGSMSWPGDRQRAPIIGTTRCKSTMSVRWVTRFGGGPAKPYAAVISDKPPMYGRITSGKCTEPSSCWKFSRMPMMIRGSAKPDPFKVCTNRGREPASGR